MIFAGKPLDKATLKSEIAFMGKVVNEWHFFNICSSPPTNGAGFIHLLGHMSKLPLPFKRTYKFFCPTTLKNIIVTLKFLKEVL